MITITYRITSGYLPITVKIPGSGVPDVVHNSYGQYQITDIPDGTYIMEFWDGYGRLCDVKYISICNDCYPGYLPVGEMCVKYDEQDPTYYSTTYTIIKKASDISYGVYGAILFTSWNYNGTGNYYRFNLNNTYWINNYTNRGPMNRTSVWGNVTTNNQDIGFSVCVSIAETKTYYIGFGCDNYGKIKLNGQWILVQNVSALYGMFTANGHPNGNGDPNRVSFRYWFIYPVELTVGDNIIEVFGHNNESVAAVGIEIYDALPSDLENATSDTDLSGKFVFRSLDIVGQHLNYEYSVAGGYHGYTCPEGYALDTCGETVKCIKKLTLECGEEPTTSTTSSSTTSSSTTSTTSSSTTSSTTSSSTTSTSTSSTTSSSSTTTTSTSNTSSTTSTSSSTTTTTTTIPYDCDLSGEATEQLYHVKMSVANPNYDFNTEQNIPYILNTQQDLQTYVVAGFNYLFLSVPYDTTFEVIDSLGMDITSLFIYVEDDVRQNYILNKIYKKHQIFNSDDEVPFTLTLTK